MKIISEPKVYLLGRQAVVAPELSRFLADHEFSAWATDSPSDAETLVEVAARNCYQSFGAGRGHAEHLRHILEVGHGSVLEHGVWNFLVVGVSRSLTHELVRHRAGWGYSQLSQRYVDEGVAECIEPDVIAGDPDTHAVWLQAVENSHEAYRRLVGKLSARFALMAEEVCPLCSRSGSTSLCGPCRGTGRRYPEYQDRTSLRKAARQAARSVLPNACETKIFLTANARAIRHFLEQRGSRHAEPEIRKLALAVLGVVRAEAPNLFGDYDAVALPDGTREVTTPWKKV